MGDELIILWDMEDDPRGNVQYIAQHGVTPDEVEEILRNPANGTSRSRSSGYPITFGYTSEGRYLVVIWEEADDDPITIYPHNAYEAPEPRRKR